MRRPRRRFDHARLHVGKSDGKRRQRCRRQCCDAAKRSDADRARRHGRRWRCGRRPRRGGAAMQFDRRAPGGMTDPPCLIRGRFGAQPSDGLTGACGGRLDDAWSAATRWAPFQAATAVSSIKRDAPIQSAGSRLKSANSSHRSPVVMSEQVRLDPTHGKQSRDAREQQPEQSGADRDTLQTQVLERRWRREAERTEAPRRTRRSSFFTWQPECADPWRVVRYCQNIATLPPRVQPKRFTGRCIDKGHAPRYV